MKLKKSTISHITKMICGDGYRDVFSRRSSSHLTEFFRIIDLEYVHNGESRIWWVQGILDQLNENGEFKDPDLPSVEMVKVIEQLVDPSEFTFPFTNHPEAIKKLNEFLNVEGLKVVIDEETDTIHLETKLGKYISTAVDKEKVVKIITFSPGVFNIPEKEVNPELVSVMMPFSSDFDDVYSSIQQACDDVNLNCIRADDIWEESVIIQDIFNLIFESSIVVADLTQKNPNVLYELGIAHTLGKHVIPITQSMDDVPFDLSHHRALKYLNNGEGRDAMQRDLSNRLKHLSVEVG